MSTNKIHQPDRVTYSESVKVNIGDYESREAHVSVSLEVGEDETPEKVLSKAKKKVKKFLFKREKEFRKKSVEDVDFETMDKL